MKKTRFAALAVAAATALALTACSSGSLSGGDKSGAPSAGGDLTPVTVGLLKIAPSAAVQMGIDDGIFAKHGLDVKVQLGQGGAALLPAVSSQSIQFAVGNPLSVLVAAGQGLDMNIIAGYSSIEVPEDKAPSGIVVKKSSGIDSWKDLAGKTVAVNALNTQGDLTTMASVEADGGDPKAVKFTEIAFPDQLAQLEQGHIDAAWVPEPFLSAALAEDGMTFLGDPMRTIPNLYTMVTFTSGAYADAHPEVVKAFRDAITESTKAAMDDTAHYDEAIVAFTGMPADVVKGIHLEHLTGTLDRSVIENLSTMAQKYSFVKQAPDLDKVIVD
nr:ABC transporter substrate-binding protein [Microbacterium bovistercoris]